MNAGDIITLENLRYRISKIDTDGTMFLRLVEKEPAEPQNSLTSIFADPSRPVIRSYDSHSAYVRIWHENSMVVGTITHCTDKAVRIISPEGAAWLPKNVMNYTSSTKNPEGFFCVTAEDYVPVFFTPQNEENYASVINGAWDIYCMEFENIETYLNHEGERDK